MVADSLSFQTDIRHGLSMKLEYMEILVECFRRMKRHKRTLRPPEWQWWDREPYDERTVHGPEYGCGEWFGVVREHQRQRYRRAIADLERSGLLVTWSRCGRRLSHVKLTPTGQQVSRALTAAARPKRPKATAAEPEANRDRS